MEEPIDAGAGPHVCQYADRLKAAEASLTEKHGTAVKFKNLYTDALDRAEAAEARLAAVEALCDNPARVMEYPDFVAEVLAAAREEVEVCMIPHAGDPGPCDCGYPGADGEGDRD